MLCLWGLNLRDPFFLWGMCFKVEDRHHEVTDTAAMSGPKANLLQYLHI